MDQDHLLTFNSRGTILFVRIGQMLLPLWMVLLLIGDHSVLTWIITLGGLVLWEALMYSMVFATLNDSGLRYRRWGKWQQMRWSEMEYGGPGLIGFTRVKLRGRPLLTRYLLLRNPKQKDCEMHLSEINRFEAALQPPSGRTN